jgi:hypothetical protein
MTDINIYCNGDSFIAGIESLDYLLPTWPGYQQSSNFKHLVIDGNKKWNQKRFKFAKDLYNKYIK